jgi:hypothetical protein
MIGKHQASCLVPSPLAPSPPQNADRFSVPALSCQYLNPLALPPRGKKQLSIDSGECSLEGTSDKYLSPAAE